MTRFLHLFIVLFFALQLKAQNIVYDANVQVREIPSFNAINVGSNFEVILTQSGEEKLAVSADNKRNADLIRAEVKDGVLRLSPGDAKWEKGNRHLKAYLSVKDIDAIYLSGAAKVKIVNALNLQNLSLKLSGASNLNGELNIAEMLTVILDGASDVYLKGAANEMRVTSNGASDIKGYDFTAAICDINVSGASQIKITAEKEISINASGASNVYYKGNANIKEIKANGASNISRKMK